MPQDFSGFLIKPSTFSGIDNAAAIQERQNEKKAQYDYQNRKDQEQDDYRKAGMLDDVTVENKLTGIPEIDRVYQEQTKRVYNDLVANARKMSFVDLKGEINKRMMPILSGLERAKMDINNGMSYVNNLTGEIKDLNKNGLVHDVTSSVKGNYINPDGTLKNVDSLNPTDFSYLDNDQYLTKLLTNTDEYYKAFDPSKGSSIEWSTDIPGGTQNLKAKVPFYIKPSVTADELMANNMRVPKGKQMNFGVVGETKDINGTGNPINLIDENIAGTLLNTRAKRLAFNKAFQEDTPGWEKLTSQQLNVLQRAYMAQTALQKGFESPQIAGTHYFPVTHNTTKVYTGSGDKEPTINDIHQNVIDVVGDKGSAEFRRLRPDAQTTILKYLNDIYRTKQEDSFTPDNVQVEKQGDQYYVVDPAKTDNDGQHHRLMPLDKTALNIKVQPTAKDRQKVVEQEGKKETSKANKAPVYKGLDKDGNPIFE